MPRVKVPLQAASSTALEPMAAGIAGDQANGHLVYPNRKLLITNGGAGAINATFLTPGAPDGNDTDDKVQSIPNDSKPRVFVLPSPTYGDPTENGLVKVDLSDDDTITLASLE